MLKILFGLLAVWCLAVPAHAQTVEKPVLEKSKVSVGVGGKELIYYLPLTIADRLGYFQSEGLDLSIVNVTGGAQALKALMAGSVDFVAGGYEHTVQMQAKGQPVTAVVQIGRAQGMALGLLNRARIDYRSPRDLKGGKIGVTAPGSSTNFMVSYMLASAGLSPSDVSIIGIGGGAGAVAAAKQGELDALCHLDPVISRLEQDGDLRIIADSRTVAGSRAVFGGDYPAGSIYTTRGVIDSRPGVTQALVTAVVRGLRWMNTATTEEIVALVPDYAANDPALYRLAVEKSREMTSVDGRLDPAGMANVHRVLSLIDPNVSAARIDLAATYDGTFVERASASRR